MEEAGADAATVTELQAVIAQLDKVRTVDSSYEVTDEMTDGTWVFYPLKRHFRAAVSRAGYISDVKLRCDKSYVFFAFDPTLNYEIHPKDGSARWNWKARRALTLCSRRFELTAARRRRASRPQQWATRSVTSNCSNPLHIPDFWFWIRARREDDRDVRDLTAYLMEWVAVGATQCAVGEAASTNSCLPLASLTLMAHARMIGSANGCKGDGDFVARIDGVGVSNPGGPDG
ncbi:MAG: hypothetical protein WDM77_10570 [Steroidobacteraceae bacterium]